MLQPLFLFWHGTMFKRSYSGCQMWCPFGRHLTLFSIFLKSHKKGGFLVVRLPAVTKPRDPPRAFSTYRINLSELDLWINAHVREAEPFSELSRRNKNCTLCLFFTQSQLMASPLLEQLPISDSLSKPSFFLTYCFVSSVSACIFSLPVCRLNDSLALTFPVCVSDCGCVCVCQLACMPVFANSCGVM